MEGGVPISMQYKDLVVWFQTLHHKNACGTPTTVNNNSDCWTSMHGDSRHFSSAMQLFTFLPASMLSFKFLCHHSPIWLIFCVGVTEVFLEHSCMVLERGMCMLSISIHLRIPLGPSPMKWQRNFDDHTGYTFATKFGSQSITFLSSETYFTSTVCWVHCKYTPVQAWSMNCAACWFAPRCRWCRCVIFFLLYVPTMVDGDYIGEVYSII